MALASMPPSAISANTTASTSSEQHAEHQRGVWVEEKVPGATTNGQPNATSPRNEAIAMAIADRR